MGEDHVGRQRDHAEHSDFHAKAMVKRSAAHPVKARTAAVLEPLDCAQHHTSEGTSRISLDVRDTALASFQPDVPRTFPT